VLKKHSAEQLHNKIYFARFILHDYAAVIELFNFFFGACFATKFGMFIIEAVIVGGFYQAVSFTDFSAVDANDIIFNFPQGVSVFDLEDDTINPKENQTAQ
jgi:hypothetical protein